MPAWRGNVFYRRGAMSYTGGSIFRRMKIRLFLKPYCPWCHKAKAWLDARGVQYEALDVIADSKAMTEMVRLSNQRFAPVIEVEGKILADFGPEELEKFWEKI
jgi:glutaredoxin 3